MDFSWEAVFSEGLGDFLQDLSADFSQNLALLGLDERPIWPPRPRNLTEHNWLLPLFWEEQPIGYLAGSGEVPPVAKWAASLCQEKVQNILLHRQLNQAQVRLIEEIKAHTDLEEALKFMELKALQSQVNPHFLFNTLTTIAGLAMFESAEHTTRLVQSLSRLLRYSLRRIGQMVSLSEELEHINDYLAIQKARFGERIRVTLEITDEASMAQIPVLTLQPIVENAIIHGLESKEEGHLSLVGYAQDERVYIHVLDNGIGIDQERLGDIQELKASMSGRSHTTGLGFSNVHKRLQHFFGTSYGLTITSELGKGTQVTVVLPFIF